MNLTNMTGRNQQVNTIKDSVVVKPGESVTIPANKIYSYELERIEPFFKIEKNKVQEVKPKTVKKAKEKQVEKENNDIEEVF